MRRNSIKLDRLVKVPALRILGNDSANPGEIVALTLAELDAMGVGAGGGQPADATLTALAALDSAAGVLYQTPASGQPGTESEAFLARMEALMTTGASPSGNFQVTLRSEGTGATHYMRATSFIRYRTH